MGVCSVVEIFEGRAGEGIGTSCAYGMTLAMNSVAHSFGSPGFSSILSSPVELPILLFRFA